MLDNHDETLQEEPRKRHSQTVLGTNGQVFSERSRDSLSPEIETVSGMVLLILRDDVTRVPPRTSLILFR